MDDRFIEWIEEEDGSLTAVCEKPSGERYELRGCKLTGIDTSQPVMSNGQIQFVVKSEEG